MMTKKQSAIFVLEDYLKEVEEAFDDMSIIRAAERFYGALDMAYSAELITSKVRSNYMKILADLRRKK